MINLAALDFELRPGAPTKEGELRLQLYVASTGQLAAWVHVMPRYADGDKVIGVSVQYVRRAHFSPTQNAAIQRWILKITNAAMSL